MKHIDKEKAKKELWYIYFNTYLFQKGLITREQKEKMDRLIAKM